MEERVRMLKAGMRICLSGGTVQALSQVYLCDPVDCSMSGSSVLH